VVVLINSLETALNGRSQLCGLAKALAQLRSSCVEEVIALTAQTALRVLPWFTAYMAANKHGSKQLTASDWRVND
jgi:hypothetical protein